jgi:Ca2+-binding RTX toxin-like protein
LRSSRPDVAGFLFGRRNKRGGGVGTRESTEHHGAAVRRGIGKESGVSMRKAAVLISVLAMVVAVFASAALAKTLNGNDNNNVIIGTNKHDAISGFGGDDVIRGYGRSDVLIGGLDADRVTGGWGQDVVDIVDGSVEDFVACGRGFDRVRADVGDLVSTDCEEVQQIAITTPPPEGDADCSDNLDNDGDGKTDFPNDPGCFSAIDPSEVGGGGGGDDDDDDD